MRDFKAVRSSRRRWLLLALCVVVVLTACSKDDARDQDPPDPAPPNSGEISGTFVLTDLNESVSDDPQDNAGANLTVIDQNHVPARRQNLTNSSYSLMTELLEPPFYLRVNNSSNSVILPTLQSVATGTGTVNITPLTDLTAAFLLARAQEDGFIDPDDYYSNFGLLPRPRPGTTSFPPPEPGPSEPSRINGAAIRRAEVAVRDALADLGVSVDPSIEDFITQPFEAEAGDPMYDTIVDLVTTLRQRNLTLDDYKDQLFAGDRLCQTVEKIMVTVGGMTQLFCPSENTTEATDNGNNYTFTTLDEDTLIVETANGMVISVELNIQGTGNFICEDGNCPGIGVSDSDDNPGREEITFNDAMLAGDDQPAMINGRLTASPPGFPSLPMSCAGRIPYYFSTVSGTRVAGCTNINDMPQFEGTRTFSQVIDNSRGVYALTVGVDDGRQVVFASVNSLEQDENSSSDYIGFKCRRDQAAASCNGVELGQGSADGTITFTFDDVSLLGVEADGTLTPTVQGRLTGSIALPPPTDNAIEARRPLDCDTRQGYNDVVDFDVTDGDWQICAPDGAYGDFPSRAIRSNERYVELSYNSIVPGDLFASPPEPTIFKADTLKVYVERQTNAVVLAYFSRNQLSDEYYACRGSACDGITVEGPNSDNSYTVALNGVALSEVQRFPTLNGFNFITTPEDRSAFASGGFTVRVCADKNDQVCATESDLPDGAIEQPQ